MKKCVLIIVPFLFLWLLITPWQYALGQGALEILVNNVELQFPAGVVFSLEAASPDVIEQVDLYYGTSGRTCQGGETRQAFDFDPDTQVSLSWEWEWKRSGILPPGAQIWWEWEITYESGEILRLPREFVTIEDQRHDWQIIDQNDIVVRWYVGDEAFGRDLHTIAIESLELQSREMGILPDAVIQITIYPTAEDLQEALVVAADWTGGVAIPDQNSLLIGIAPGEVVWANSVMPHELNHLLIGTLFFNCRGAFMPTWLSEGLAEFAEDPEGAGSLNALNGQLAEDSLPPLRSLARGFSAYGDGARLSYLHSKLIVTYLYEEYRQEEVLALLETLRAGETIDQSLDKVYGFDTDGLDRAWRESLGFSLPENAQDDEADEEPTKTPIPTIPLMDLGLEPSPTTMLTPLPPTARPTQQPAEAERTPTAAAVGEVHTPVPDLIEEGQGSSLWLYLVAGAGALVLISLVIYFQFFRR